LTFRDDRVRKLSPLYCGPFPVKTVVNDNAYELELPNHFTIHPVINVSKLLPYKDGRAEFPGRPPRHARPPPDAVDSNGADQYQVERVLAHSGRGHTATYLVLWKDYPYEEASWVPAENLRCAPEAVAEYLRAQKDLPRRQRQPRAVPAAGSRRSGRRRVQR
jgi:hypothetical protein